MMENEIKEFMIYFGVMMAFVLPLGIYVFILLDKIIKRLYETFNFEWENMGKPCGIFYYPPNTKNIQSMLSMQLNMFRWIFKTPAWIKTDLISLSYLKKLRWLVLITNIGMISPFFYLLLIMNGF